MLGISPEEIYKYGSYIFIFYVATFLVRKMWSLFEGRVKDIYDNTTENKKINKDIAVIQAQTLKNLDRYERNSDEAWKKLLAGFDRMLEFMNGRNPAIAKLRAEIKELEDKIG
jgi:carboxypeptidase C (cathepsin A)